MYPNFIILTFITMISAQHGKRYSDFSQNGNHGPVITIFGVTRSYVNSNARRAIDNYGYGGRAYDSAVNYNDYDQGRKSAEKEGKKITDTLPLILFPDQKYYKVETTVRNDLLNRYDKNTKYRKTSNINQEFVNNTVNVPEESKTIMNNTRIRTQLSDVINRRNSTMSMHRNQSSIHIHDTAYNSMNSDVNNDDVNKTIHNYTRIKNHVNNTNHIHKSNDHTSSNGTETARMNEGIPKIEGGKTDNDVWVWSSGVERITVPTIVDDRAAFTGDNCPEGKVKLNNSCVVQDD